MKQRTKSLAILAALVFLGVAGGRLAAQQMTRIAVLDLQKVIASYPRDSGALKAFEQNKAQVQAEIYVQGAEINKLQAQRAALEGSGDKAGAQRLDGEISRKTEALREYVKVKKAELDEQYRKLPVADSFTQAVMKLIETIAVSNGYSIVLNLSSADSVMSGFIWYSPEINVTDEVIQALVGKAQ
jgi:outer membrane protein